VRALGGRHRRDLQPDGPRDHVHLQHHEDDQLGDGRVLHDRQLRPVRADRQSRRPRSLVPGSAARDGGRLRARIGRPAVSPAAGALLAPDFLVYPENGAISTFKGFEIIVIGGLGSILGSVVGGVLLGVIEALGSVFVSSAYKDLYGFLLLIALLVFRPTGLFGERERSV